MDFSTVVAMEVTIIAARSALPDSRGGCLYAACGGYGFWGVFT